MTQKQRATTNHVQLPLMANVAIYARVATHDKLSPSEDRQNQGETLTKFANQLGYSVEQVTLYTDEGRAAAAPLMERQGYTALLQAISKGDISVLLVSGVSRLLANATEMQVNIFISRCIDKGVYIVTPQATYDFTNLSSIHQFRVHCTNAFTVLKDATKQMQATQ
jgi:DNA invertase Pin-like site-specific DNA recombinase